MRFRTPRFVILVIAAVGALAMCGTRVSAKVPWVFKNLNNALGVADRQGYCSVWCYFDETVDAGGGVELPVRFQFNSYQRSMADSCLGAGWWFPLLESTVIRDSEKNIRVNLPGGDVVRLYPSKTEQGKFHTLDNARTGTVLEGVLTMEGRDGWRFTYEAGRLKEAGTPGGDVLRWEYDGNRATRITSRTSGALLDATHDPATGLIVGLTFNEGKENMRLGYADAPLTNTSQNGGTANRLVKSLGSVRSRDFAATISFRSVDEARSMEMVVDYANEGGEKGVDKYRWSTETGLIQRDNFGPYVVRGGGVNPGDAVFYVENVTREGKKKSYQYDRKKNEEVYGAEDGRKFIYQYVETPGPAYNKLRRVTDIMPDGKEIISFIGFFDQSGILRRKLEASGRYTEILYVKSWDPAEAIPLMCKFTPGDKEDLEVVGPQGRLIGAVITGEPYVYIHAADGKLLDRPSMMNYLRSHPEISVPKDLPPWLEAAFDHEGRRQSGQ